MSALSRLQRLMLICFIALALPLQGAAAALRLGCLPDRGQGHGQHVPAAAPQSTGHEGQGAASSHAHHAEHAHQASAAGQADPGATNLSRLPGTPHTCSACAACCLGAVLLAPQLSPPAVTPLVHGVVFQAFSVGPVRFVTGGPDRPPRSTQA